MLGRPVTWPDVWLAFVREIVALAVVIGGVVVALKLASMPNTQLGEAIGSLIGTGFVAMLGRSRPPGGATSPGGLLVVAAVVGAGALAAAVGLR